MNSIRYINTLEAIEFDVNVLGRPPDSNLRNHVQIGKAIPNLQIGDSLTRRPQTLNNSSPQQTKQPHSFKSFHAPSFLPSTHPPFFLPSHGSLPPIRHNPPPLERPPHHNILQKQIRLFLDRLPRSSDSSADPLHRDERQSGA